MYFSEHFASRKVHKILSKGQTFKKTYRSREYLHTSQFQEQILQLCEASGDLSSQDNWLNHPNQGKTDIVINDKDGIDFMCKKSAT